MLDEDILKKAQEGDYKSIEEICTRTWEPLYRFIYFKVQNREEAEDITQETYVKALSFLKKGHEKIEKTIAFLKAVSLNVLRDRWRRHKRRGPDIHLEDVSPDYTAIDDVSDEFATRELIKSALERLGIDQRTVIELRIIKGYSVRETARIMDKKEGTIRVLQYRALQNLESVIRRINKSEGGLQHEQA